MRGVGAAVMAALAICSGALGAGAPMPEAVLPANGDEVSPDLSDPGLEGAIRVRIPVPPGRVRWLLRPRNQFDKTGPAVHLLDCEFARVPADAAYRRRDRMLTVRPGLPLPPGQYTLTLDRSLLVRRRHLDDDGGIEDFRTSFTVGPDIHAPVVRQVSPAANQSRVPPFTPVRVVFNESLDPATCVLGRSVFVEDVGRDPPVAVAGTLVAHADGFVLRFVPDPCSGYSPSTRVRVRLAGGGDPEAVRDRAGNALAADFSLLFDTGGEGPLPDDRRTPPAKAALYVTTGNGILAFDLRGALGEDGSFHPEAIRPVDAGGGYGGVFRARVGRPGDAVLDPRAHSDSGHSFLFAIDEEAGDVAVVETATGRVAERLGGFQRPRSLAIVGPAPGATGSVLFVADSGAGALVSVPVDAMPGTPICPDLVYSDAPPGRGVVAAGLAGIAGVAAVRYAREPLAEFPLVMTVLPGRSEAVQLFGIPDSSRWEAAIESGPTEAGWSPLGPLGAVCWITAAARGLDGGAVTLWSQDFSGLRQPFTFDPWSPGIRVSEPLREWIRDPGPPCPIPGTSRCLVPNRGGETVVELDATRDLDGRPSPSVLRVLPAGAGPASVATDATGRLAFVALPAEGAFAVIDLLDPAPVPFRIPVDGIRRVITAATQ